MDRPRVLLIDAAPGDLLDLELDRLLGAGLAVTLNLRRVDDRAAVERVRGGPSGPRLTLTDFDGFDPAALTAACLADGLGHDAVKSRSGAPLGEALFAAATDPALAHRLRVVGRAGAGIDHIDAEAAARYGIAIAHTPGSNAEAVAEFALAQLLTLARGLLPHHTAAHQGRWVSLPQRQLAELTLGIVGLGRIGRALARRATALGLPVLALTRSPFDLPGVRRAASLPALLAEADAVSLHLPLTPQTRGLIGAAELAAMRPGSYLLNTARGGLVDEQALATALADPAHPLAAAAIDTFAHEHAAFDTPLRGLPNALLTPHIAGTTRTAQLAAALSVADQIVEILGELHYPGARGTARIRERPSRSSDHRASCTPTVQPGA
ncbi:oxidoreductase [Kitasatospora sp. MMS16-BH015]|uniref:NAD(P)-dependent oxidoreductase n=1 Tax=Kitasatospora sp. MMS16-BH015 TaxID=2018025 RepID=UPI000CA23030|nr:NAD(P)-dependent oxidoreductase [Kitasatospora sp. MMS16-BH015]AUG79703.1 oxidoreductase [Kitasatospora sp. MMS16-BH015]